MDEETLAQAKRLGITLGQEPSEEKWWERQQTSGKCQGVRGYPCPWGANLCTGCKSCLGDHPESTCKLAEERLMWIEEAETA